MNISANSKLSQSIAISSNFSSAQFSRIYFSFKDIGIAGFWNGIPSLFRYRPALEYRPVTDFYGIPAEGYLYCLLFFVFPSQIQSVSCNNKIALFAARRVGSFFTIWGVSQSPLQCIKSKYCCNKNLQLKMRPCLSHISLETLISH